MNGLVSQLIEFQCERDTQMELEYCFEQLAKYLL